MLSPVFLSALLILSAVIPKAHGQAIDISRLYALKSYRTPSRRFVTLSSRTLDNLQMGRWAETVADRAEAILGGPIPFELREIHIVVRPAESVATGTVAVADCMPRELSQGVRGAQLVQKMVIPDMACLSEAPACAAFCRLLLEGFLPSSRGHAEPVQVPRWVTVGLARNLWREQRGVDAHAMVALWKSGKVPPLVSWLNKEPGDWDADVDDPMSALLFAWLVEPPDGYHRVRRLLSALEQGESLSGDRLGWERVGAQAAPADLEIAWDAWIMRQQRKVFRPGTTPPDILQQLSAALLLYPGAFGIPLTSGIERGENFSTLIKRRHEDWIPGFARAKLAALRTLTAGRGAAVYETVEKYGAFLDALEQGKRPGRLKKLLRRAEASWQDLETDHDGKDTQNTGGER